jgi:dGTPase
VEVLEERYPEFPGLNLLFETREGILKHCSVTHARHLGELGRRFLAGTQPSLEAQLANVADEIAYNHHDIDDGLRANLLSLEQLLQFPLFSELYDAALRRWHDTGSKKIQHSVIREMLNYFVVDLIRSTRTRLARTAPKSLDEARDRREPLVDFSASVRAQHLDLKRILRRDLYHHDRVLHNADNARVVVTELFKAFFDDPQLLPEERMHGQLDDDVSRAQIIADYVAGMTDRFAIAEHKRIFHNEQFVVA